MKKTVSILLIVILLFVTNVSASDKSIAEGTANYILNTVTEPNIGSVGGEWSVIGLKRSGADVPEEYYDNYYNRVKEYIISHNGVLHERKYTEYSRVVLALTAIGADVTDVAGYNLLEPLADFEKTVWQGTNGAIWALIALDSADYEIPGTGGATRQMYVDKILAAQNADGGFSLVEGKGTSDIDITAMAMVALSNYTEYEDAENAVKKALGYISASQEEDGGFISLGNKNSESVVQVICALCALQIPLDDARFVKNGNTLLDNLLSFITENGGFEHVKGGGDDLMATEQALYALTAVSRFENGQPSLFDMTDADELSADDCIAKCRQIIRIIYNLTVRAV